jgi:hypothetical protein
LTEGALGYLDGYTMHSPIFFDAIIFPPAFLKSFCTSRLTISAMLNFSLPVQYQSVAFRPIESGNQENKGFAVETAFLTGLQAEIQVLGVC